jgi:4-diphosphocytidyl-2-C-methyl-D-erythritol kinase
VGADAYRFSIDAPAKLNLSLAVSAEVRDGKHLLESVYTTIGLSDRLDFTYDAGAPRSFDIRLRYASGLFKVRVPQAMNIVTLAVRAFEEGYGCTLEGQLAIRVQKRIPIQAGLGGGSSDAAAALIAMQRLTGIEPDASRLRSMAAELGADVAFFLQGGCALMGGHGDAHERTLRLPTLDLVLVKPPKQGLSTGMVYAEFAANPQPSADITKLVGLLDGATPPSPAAVAAHLSNNLTAAATALLPEIADIISDLEAQPGILGALMAGSGSTVFAIADGQEAAMRTAAHFNDQGLWAIVSRTI